VVIKLQRPMFVEPTQRFTMRLHGSTLATGVIVNVRPALTEVGSNLPRVDSVIWPLRSRERHRQRRRLPPAENIYESF
jgi:hypothetical protein